MISRRQVWTNSRLLHDEIVRLLGSPAGDQQLLMDVERIVNVAAESFAKAMEQAGERMPRRYVAAESFAQALKQAGKRMRRRNVAEVRTIVHGERGGVAMCNHKIKVKDDGREVTCKRCLNWIPGALTGGAS